METYCKHWETVRTHTVSVVFIAVIWKTCQRGDSFILLPQRAYSSQQHAWTCMFNHTISWISVFSWKKNFIFQINIPWLFWIQSWLLLSFQRYSICVSFVLAFNIFLMSPLKTFIVKCMTTPLIFTCKSKAPVCRWFINLQNKTETSHILQIISVIKARSVDDPYFMLITLNGHACQIYGRNQTDSFSMFKGETALS